MGCAVFVDAERKLILTGLMLFLPLIDQHTLGKDSNNIIFSYDRPHLVRWFSLTGLIGLLLLVNPMHQTIPSVTSLISIILFTALPEEWFFRKYLQNGIKIYLSRVPRFKKQAIQAHWYANIITSVLFACIHIPIQGILGLAVFIPSLILGYLYELKQDIIFVILLHSLFNVFFMIYLQEFIINIITN